MHLAAAGLFLGTWLIRLSALVGFPNDHFLYLAPAQQMLVGELPSRDFVDPGTPLMYVVSALARLVVDSPLLAEALVVSTALGLAAALTVYAAFSASGSVWIAVAVTLAEVALFPRSYHYPKLLLYAAGVLAMWRYAREPSWARAAVLAGCIALAFLFRHDHGAYLGVAALATVATMPHPGWKDRARGVAQILGLVALLLLPYLMYVEATVGLAEHVASGVAYSRSETDRTVIGLPMFDLSTITSADNARVSLYYVWHLLPPVAIAVLIWRRVTGTTVVRSEWASILPLAVLAIAVNVALLRDPLQTRLPDVAVPVCLLAAWLIPQAWRGTGRRCVIRRALVLVMTGVAMVGINVVGSPAEQLDRAALTSRQYRPVAQLRERVRELQEPFPPTQFPSRIAQALVPFFEYVGRCTSHEQRLFVAGNAPEIYVFARRLFAGGQPALRSGFFSAARDQRRLVLKMRQQDVPLALVLSEGDATEFTLVMAELESEFQPIGAIPVQGWGTVFVRAHRRHPSNGVDTATGFPCFR